MSLFSPLLYRGITRAIFSTSGKMPALTQLLNSIAKVGDDIRLNIFKTRGDMSEDLFGFNLSIIHTHDNLITIIITYTCYYVPTINKEIQTVSSGALYFCTSWLSIYYDTTLPDILTHRFRIFNKSL